MGLKRVNKLRYFQLWLNQHYKTIRNGLLAIFLVGFLAFQFTILLKLQESINDGTARSKALQYLGKDNKKLNQNATTLTEQNQVLAKQNRAYTRCGFLIFAKYTRDLLPVTNLDLDACSVGNQDDQQINAPTPLQAPAQTNSGGAPSLQSPAQAPAPVREPTKAPTPTAPQTHEVCTINLLGIKLNCRQEPV